MIYSCASSQYVRTAIRSVTETEIRPQRTFNWQTTRIQNKVHERLELVEEILFGILMLACVLFLVVHSLAMGFGSSISGTINTTMTFVGALIPACGAVILGIRSQGDFSASSARSADTVAKLDQVLLRAEELLARADPLEFQDLVDLNRRCVSALSNDVSFWRIVYRRKRLTITT